MTSELTLLDRKHAAMQNGGVIEQLSFYQSFVDTPLVIWLDEESKGDQISPRTAEFDGGDYIMAFDLEERLADMAGGAAQTATLPGRALAHMLQDQRLGIAFNLGDAPSAMLIPPEAVDWIVETLGAVAQNQDTLSARPIGFEPPRYLPENLIAALSERLVRIRVEAYLSWTTYESGEKGHLLAICGIEASQEQPTRDAIAEALTFSGVGAGAIDLAFLATGDPVLSKMRGRALRFEPPLPRPATTPGTAPGMNPDQPPKLK